MSPKYLVAAIMAALMSAPVSAQSVKAGIDAWQKADYSAAVAIWRPLADRGDADAQFNLGQAYRLGRGVPISLGQAKTWFERAAASGHLDAQTTLGLLLFQNGDQAEGLKWLRRAAEADEPRALLVYGTALYNGDGVTQDRLLGYAYVSRAAASGLSPAKDTLAQLDQLMPAADRQKALVLAHVKPNAAAAATKASKGRNAQLKPAAPKPRATKPAAAKPAPAPIASGAWRIQLGAFSQRGGAEALYRRLSGKPALAGRAPFYISAGGVTRLQAGPFASRAAAAAACASLGTACFPIPAK
jgi:cell division septation protein DedD